ncbi:MAG: FAD-binding oxidoreductase, partial [Gammaproteobacteria bacterium]|nr:FAD-binding oxidoreductase [Gammaproteobacteria bacterium]
HLPFKLSKGEILKVVLDTPITAMLNWRQWLVPDSSDGTQALLGSNYAWGDFSSPESVEPSQEARDYLIMRLNTNTTLKADVIDHKAGIRPTPTQRFPFVGPHKQLSNIYCFNGFGSKGCHTIPYYSQLLADHLIDQSPSPNEITQWL